MAVYEDNDDKGSLSWDWWLEPDVKLYLGDKPVQLVPIDHVVDGF